MARRPRLRRPPRCARPARPAGPPRAPARVNSPVADSIASSRLAATTISWAPYRVVPMPVAMPPLVATASASSTTSARLSTRAPSASIPPLHLMLYSARPRPTVTGAVLTQGRQQPGEFFQAVQVVPGQQQVDVGRGDHHAQRAGPEARVVPLVRIHPDQPVAEP